MTEGHFFSALHIQFDFKKNSRNQNEEDPTQNILCI